MMAEQGLRLEGPSMGLKKSLASAGLMSIYSEGQERSFADYQALLGAAGYTNKPTLVRRPSTLSIIEVDV